MKIIEEFRALPLRGKAFVIAYWATLPITFPVVIAYGLGAGGYLLNQRDMTERSRKLVQANINLRAENERLRGERINAEQLKAEIGCLNREIEWEQRKLAEVRSNARHEINRFMFMMRDEIAAAEAGKSKRELLTDRIKEHARKALHQIEAEPVIDGNVVRIFKPRPTAGELPE